MIKKFTNPKTTGTKEKITLPQIKAILAPVYYKHRLRLTAGFTALLCVDFLQLIVPRIIKYCIDGLESATISSGRLLQFGGLILLIAVVVIVLRFSWRYLIIGFSRILEQTLRNKIFSHILKMDALFFERHTSGDLMAHSTNDLAAVQMACGMGMVAGVDSFVMCFAAIGFMIGIHPTLTLLALLPLPILAVSTRILSGKLHNRFATVQEQFADLTEFSRSTLISIGLIKAYTMESLQTARFDTLGKKYVKSNLRVATLHGLISPLATVVGNCGMLMVLYFGGRLVIKDDISLGDFVAFITYLYMLIWPMMAIGWVANLVQRGLTSLGRIHNLLASRPSLPAPVPANTLITLKQPSFYLKNLTFTYSSAEVPALENITLKLEPGIHGFTGRTGSGKSTLCKLLTRLYPVADDMLFFDNTDVNKLPVEFIRSHIGYVSQEPILFSDTIAANIGFARPDASRKEIIQAAENSAIHADIMALNHGYDTMIGERGVKLSGGQRQRLALARALLSNRPVLIIDDGLSAVDVATEHEVFAGLKRYFSNKTILIVSNRIKLLSMTDRIIIIGEGKIEHKGGHNTLLKENSLYRSMYKKQMKQDTVEEPSTP